VNQPPTRRGLGWEPGSLAGCFSYGAIAAKITVVRSKGLAGWGGTAPRRRYPLLASRTALVHQRSLVLQRPNASTLESPKTVSGSIACTTHDDRPDRTATSRRRQPAPNCMQAAGWQIEHLTASAVWSETNGTSASSYLSALKLTRGHRTTVCVVIRTPSPSATAARMSSSLVRARVAGEFQTKIFRFQAPPL
jgi:hypothetical protein